MLMNPEATRCPHTAVPAATPRRRRTTQFSSLLTLLAASGALLLMTRTAAAEELAVSVSQAVSFPEVLPLGVFAEQTTTASGWDSPFPFTAAGQISTIRFEFSSTDPDYATGPTGGNPGVEIGVISEDPSPTRTSLSSVNTASPSVVIHQGLTSVFPLVESLVLDGEITASLGAFEAFPTHTVGLTLDEPSSLTITVEGVIDCVTVAIDIKPGSFPNSINLGSEGVVPVAILTTSVADGDAADFDAADVDQATLTLEGATARSKGKSGNIGSFEDVDGDGDQDLVVQFPTADLNLTEEDVKAVVQGRTLDNVPLVGSDSISVVP